MTIVEVMALMKACAAAATSPDVACTLCNTVFSICDRSNGSAQSNRSACGSADVLTPIIAAIRAHGRGAGSEDIAGKGLAALGNLSIGNTVNADAIVRSKGLDVILSVMESHAGNADVQKNACAALVVIAGAASAASKPTLSARAPAVVSLINQAKRNHSGNVGVNKYAGDALAKVTPFIVK